MGSAHAPSGICQRWQIPGLSARRRRRPAQKVFPAAPTGGPENTLSVEASRAQEPPVHGKQAPPPLASLGAAQKRNDSENQEHKEQDLRNPGRTGGNTAEAQNRGHDGDNEKHDCVMKHFYLPPPAFCVGVVRCIFPFSSSGRYRRRPRFYVRRVRRAHTADMSPLFISQRLPCVAMVQRMRRCWTPDQGHDFIRWPNPINPLERD